ncbi:putative ABC transport system permease protein [Humibacillus xanthopallidus]|uniref:Putative ABC transport system permease protein n=1 Tax=Humibacillus xanthopallidus TaxID=412689 RepID=A0A543PUR7_9MICO|nr:ABC transporter permease [Humibacillus xanthopallidus]TQN47818.1 putative ABC transport system permease protein [Humibacillus xanthopallidus]
MFVAIRDLRFAKGRFALMGAVVALITLLVVLLSGLTVGLGRGNTSAVTDLGADHLVFAAPPVGQKLAFTDSSVSPAVRSAWSRVPGVRSAEPVVVAMTRAATAGRTAGVAVFAVPPGSPLVPGGGDGGGGSGAAGSVAPGRVVVSTGAAAALDVTAGDRIDLAGRSVTVGEVSGADEFSHAPVVWAATANAPASGLEPGHATFLALTTGDTEQRAVGAADGGSGLDADLAAADQRLGTVTLTPAQSVSAIGSFSSENGSLQLMRALLFAISALVIGAFFTVWTVQRSGEIAILKALGASTRYLLGDALGQALALLLVGTAAGAAVAAAAGAVITTTAGSTVPFVLDLPTLLVPVVVMTVLGLAGAAFSLRTVTTVDPLTALGSAR